MKVCISFKTPDAMDDAIQAAVKREVSKTPNSLDSEALYQWAYRACSKFVEYGECVSVEIDTDTGEAKVLPV